MNIIFQILLSLISWLIWSIITMKYYEKQEIRKDKIRTLKDLVGYRFDLKWDNFSRSLNEIIIVFGDSWKIIKCLNDFHEVIINKGTDPTIINSKLLSLIKEMCNNLNINIKDLNDSFMLNPFNVKE
jgi:hypothetical protein